VSVRQQSSIDQWCLGSIAVSSDHARPSGLSNGEKLAGRLADEIWDIGDGGEQLVRNL
jgi:hypothetical protein